ncbi:MAG: hypothetical protein ACTSV8_07510 [Candidatus Thorarchaeota archaeon]
MTRPTSGGILMGKALAVIGLILIVVGLLPIIAATLTLAGLEQIIAYLYMLGLYSMDIAGYTFSETMLALVGVGVVLLIVGATR